jgi:hypothetical protein
MPSGVPERRPKCGLREEVGTGTLCRMFRLEHFTLQNNFRRKLLILRAGILTNHGIQELGCGRNVYFRGLSNTF